MVVGSQPAEGQGNMAGPLAFGHLEMKGESEPGVSSAVYTGSSPDKAAPGSTQKCVVRVPSPTTAEHWV